MLRASNEVDVPYKRSSILFGDATFIDNLDKATKNRLEQQVAWAKFWFMFRYSLVYTAPVLFIATFLLPLFFVNKTDGFLFCGSLLSVVFSSLAILSYWHIKPWRRHPSPLVMQICLSGLAISLIFLVNTVPFGRVDELSDGEDIAVADNEFDAGRDRTVKCVVMSLLMQLALLSREAWILTLSVDLLTSITNPFASHTASQRKYHLFVWLVALSGALLLVNHKQCQGQFLTNGVCWIRLDSISNGCFWGYFFCWMITFYVNSAAVLFYAYTRISKGLESTYATRFACVADTFRVVVFYFSYGLLLATLLLLMYYVVETNANEDGTLAMQHVVAYFVACRGFFDALVWFFTHGFICSSDTVTNFAINAQPVCRRRLTMRDIIRPKFFYEKVIKTLRLSTAEQSVRTSERLSSLLTNPADDLSLSASAASSSNAGRNSTHLPFRQDSEKNSDEDLVDVDEQMPLRTHQLSTASSLGQPLLSDLDVSPQLNLALRKEVVDVVTLGIRESVRRMLERESALQMLGRPSTSPLRTRGESEVSASSSAVTRTTDQDVFFPVRLSNSLQEGMFPIDPNQILGPPAARREPPPPQPNMVQSFHYSKSSMRLSNALHGILSAVGTHWPGEYGVDHAAYDVSNLNYNHFASFAEEVKADPTATASPLTAAAAGTATGSGAQGSGPGVVPLPPPPPAEVVFTLLDKHRFRDFRPATFRKLRRLAGLTEEQYLDIISQPTRERLSEGGSGAFFFVCGDGEFIVKTVQHSEATTLLGVLDRYCQHLVAHPESFLVRFLGLHEINMYGNNFTFVIMKNVFPPGIRLNERYDLKGSWVNRNASLRAPGKLATCRHCHESFVDGGAEKCPVLVGEHEASLTFKDNDMTSKIRLYSHHAYEVIDTLFHDSDALCEMGLTDYSLLVGVQYAHYDVDALRNSQVNAANYFDAQSPDRDMTGERKAADGGDSFRIPGAGTGVGATMPYAQKYPARIVIAPQDYYFGVIDVLQTWSWSKKLERWFKIYVLGQDAAGISCMCPADFRTRFQQRIAQIVEHAVFVREVTGSWQGKREVGKPYALVSS